MTRCAQELCQHWSGDGNVCPCALFDLDPPHSRCRDCGCLFEDHNRPEIGGCTSCGDCDGWAD